jgi:hypothetical protein
MMGADKKEMYVDGNDGYLQRLRLWDAHPNFI